MNTLTALDFMKRLHATCHFWSREQNRTASNSELRRWLEHGAIVFNTEKVSPNELIDFPVFSLVMFPNSKVNRITLV